MQKCVKSLLKLDTQLGISQLKNTYFLITGTALHILSRNTDLLGQFVTPVNLNGVAHAFLFCI